MSRSLNVFVQRSPRIILAALIFCAIILGIPVIERALTSAYIYNETWSLPHADAAMILGASVQHHEPSPILLERARQAVLLYRLGIVPRILVSGDAGSSYYDEVTPVKDYLLAMGIPAKDVFLDPDGFDTYSSMYRAVHIYNSHSLIIVSQDFHLPRAVFIARVLGITAYGSTAPGGTLLAYAREIPASWKAILDLLTHRQSKFAGAPHPLVGSGTTTWSNN